MTQRSRFFDSSGGDRTYDSAAFAQVISGLIDTGIVSDAGNEYAVSESSPPAMSVKVETGKAFILGYFHEVYTSAETIAIAAAHATLPRIDRVVLRRSLTNRTVDIQVLTGTPAASPTAPALTQSTSGTYEITLAQVRVDAAVVSIVNAKITDERTYAAARLGTAMDTTTGHDHDGTDSKTVAWASISGKPASFAPTAHALSSASHTGQLDHGVALTGLTDDDHTQYQLESQKNAQNGYAGLDNDASARVAAARMGTGSTGAATQVLRGDRSWGAVPTHASTHATGSSDPVTPAAIGAASAYDTPATADGGKRIYVGSATPTGASEGDVWIDG